MVSAAFVAPFLADTTNSFLLAAARTPGVRLGLITTASLDQIPGDIRAALAGHYQVQDGLDAQQLADAVRGLSTQIGPVERIVAILEQLQVPLGQVRDALGIPGMGEAAALNVREKSRMKDVLTAAGLPCARHQLVHHVAQAIAFRDLVGFPIVAKPPDGAGAQATFRLDTLNDFDNWLAMARANPSEAWLLEEFLTGREHSFDAATLRGETLWASISDYVPPPLEVVRNPWMQWSVVLPQDISGQEYAEIHRIGPRAINALGVHDAFSHMEWFARPDGSVAVSEIGARPPGAQIGSMIGFAHDINFFELWSRLVLLDEFTRPDRAYACGTAYLRGMGRGRVRTVHGIDQLQAELGPLVVRAQLPRPGAAAATSYEGEGFVTIRHHDTDVVRAALERIVQVARVEFVESD